MRLELTKKIVEKTKPEASDLFIWDTETPGFGLKITPKGKRIYICQYRVNGRSRRLSLGRHGVITIDQARKAAKEKLGSAALGEDPAAIRSGATVQELAERYIKEHAQPKKKPSSVKNDEWLLGKIILPKLGKSRVTAITRADVAELHHAFRGRPYIANRSLSLLSKMMNLAEAWGLRPDGSNPCRHIEKFKEQKRRRFLNPEELARLGAALTEAQASEPPQALAAIRLLLFTGARLSEILTCEWPYVDLQESALILPDSKTGFKSIALSAPAREIIESLPVIEGNPYIITGHRQGGHFVGLQSVWVRIRKAAKIPDVRLHDLRHSYASVGAAASLGLPIIGALLGHHEASTTQRYAHLQSDPLKAAAELIGEKIDKAMKTKPKKLRRVK